MAGLSRLISKTSITTYIKPFIVVNLIETNHAVLVNLVFRVEIDDERDLALLLLLLLLFLVFFVRSDSGPQK